ncbi:multiple inositol polyphosphate phosphatase 1-like [Spodoptera litura]|uniref:Multiple inositol polyphosphate phosphatase 1 n=1 Tax=Spodoptera litura TaxID=69820 RepID=A0A9J7EI90_SPOLT|nr:multiple inositol polyphosphate phosphatase 1-like [Spodoptera litura]XP_022831182.1 multiple inositol polyphosphate phosphatase 1-like [Spodoptera litura]XP_022831183.1 multiple inositol polyphosphate phosphatase 1-like [Spodoptera litura]XP_022831184.1 multiple inositol polyphosphate phosphatase 1-like [Spodoptera litura]XP_022831185.1 multiple inositol polyphosphate phosphatase 1-like [Spodoptera litura]
MKWLFLLLVLAFVSGEETCLSVLEEPYFLFGTKTAYTFANRVIPTARTHDIPGCQPIAFWLLNRHGSHKPEANEVVELQKLGDLKNNIVTNYRNGNFRNTNQRICSSDLNLLEQWRWDDRHNLTFAGDLTSDGYMTTQQFAQAWKQRFPGLMTSNSQNYLFKFVNDQRSSNTFKSFTEGLFGDQAESLDIPKENDEKLLRPFKFCPAWNKSVGENNDTVSQLNIFESKMEFKEMISNISLRLGFNYDIQKEIVLRIYEMCRYNKAWDVSKISPWCAAFTNEDLKRLEYAEDLDTYYRYGYGSPMNKDVGCTFVKDMMTFFEKHVTNNNQSPLNPRATIHLTEAAMMLMTLTAMGAHQDSAPLTGDNYHSAVVQSRKWTASTMTPFNANLAAVLYKCTQNGNFQVNEEYQVLFLENERPMNLPGCRVGLCDWSLIKSRYGDLTKNCDLKFCNSGNNLNGLTGISIAILGFIVSYVIRI